jgi:D-inositol-3-phosphate glycosyltransferase
MSLRLAMLSVHTCPLAAPGGKQTGGMNVYVRELSRELGRMGVEVDVYTRSQNPGIPRVVALGERAHVIHLAAGPERPLPSGELADHVDEFVEGVEEWRIVRGDYDLIYAHYWLSGLAGLALRERWGVPALQMFHTLGRLKNSVARSPGEIEPLRRIEAEMHLARSVDRVVAANAVEREQLVRQYNADPGRIATIPCGVDTDLFRPGDPAEARRRLGLDGGPVVLYVGRLEPIKGLDTLFDAVASLRAAGLPVTVQVVGGDADEQSPSGHEGHLRWRIRELGLTASVRFRGPQPQSTLRDYYVAADATVLPSYYESFGMVALEAMACGSPVVGSRVGGLTTTVRDGVTGYLVPEGDAAALAQRLADLTADPDARERLGREGVRWAAQHRWPCVAEAICREFAALEPLAETHLLSARCRE